MYFAWTLGKEEAKGTNLPGLYCERERERDQSHKCFQSVGPEFFMEPGKSSLSLASFALSICTPGYSLLIHSTILNTLLWAGNYVQY